MQTLRIVACSEAYHRQFKTSPRMWSRLALVGYSRGVDDECLEWRNCPCGSSLIVTFRPDFEALAAIRQMDLTPVALAEMMVRGSREAGLIFCERYPANARRS